VRTALRLFDVLLLEGDCSLLYTRPLPITTNNEDRQTAKFRHKRAAVTSSRNMNRTSHFTSAIYYLRDSLLKTSIVNLSIHTSWLLFFILVLFCRCCFTIFVFTILAIIPSLLCDLSASLHEYYVTCLMITARQHSLVLSACRSVTAGYHHVKMTQTTIMQSSQEDSRVTLVSSWLTSPRNSEGNIGSGGAESERDWKNAQFSANTSPYLRKCAR